MKPTGIEAGSRQPTHRAENQVRGLGRDGIPKKKQRKPRLAQGKGGSVFRVVVFFSHVWAARLPHSEAHSSKELQKKHTSREFLKGFSRGKRSDLG